MGQSTTRYCIHLSGSSDAALAGERPFKPQKNMKRPDPCWCHYMVLKHPLQTALLFPSKKPGLPLLETKPKQSTKARTAVHWSGNGIAILRTPGLVMRLAKPLETVTTSEHMAVSAKWWRLWRQKWPAEAEGMFFEHLGDSWLLRAPTVDEWIALLHWSRLRSDQTWGGQEQLDGIISFQRPANPKGTLPNASERSLAWYTKLRECRHQSAKPRRWPQPSRH